MRGSLAAAAVGMVGLSLLALATATPAAGKRAGGILGGVGKFVRWIVDPTVPAIPDRHATAAPQPTGPPATTAPNVPNTPPAVPTGGGRYQQP